jgi:hypothetical protein
MRKNISTEVVEVMQKETSRNKLKSKYEFIKGAD